MCERGASRGTAVDVWGERIGMTAEVADPMVEIVYGDE